MGLDADDMPVVVYLKHSEFVFWWIFRDAVSQSCWAARIVSLGGGDTFPRCYIPAIC